MAELILRALLVAVVAYFCGCFNGAVIVSKYILHNDVRNHGSGNAGLTNFMRVFGKKMAVFVILPDVLKAVVAVLVGAAVAGAYAPSFWEGELVTLGKLWAAMFCLLGHMFPCMFEFKGGKGVLSGGIIAILVDWRVALVVWGGFILLVLITRWVSLGSCWAGLTFPISIWFVFQDPLVTAFGIVCGGLLLIQHRGNIVRLLKGTEPKFGIHKIKESDS